MKVRLVWYVVFWMITNILGVVLKIYHAEPAFIADALLIVSFFVLIVAIFKLVTRYDKLPS